MCAAPNRAPSGGDAGPSAPAAGGDEPQGPDGLPPAEHELPLYDQYAPRRSKRAAVPTGRKASTTNLAAAGGEYDEFDEEDEQAGGRAAKKPAGRGRGAKKQPAGRGKGKAGKAGRAAKGVGDDSDGEEYDSQASSEGLEESSEDEEDGDGDGGTFATEGGTETGTEVGLATAEAMQLDDYVPVDRVLGMRVAADGVTREYCIKVVDKSFRDLVWRTHDWLVACAPGKLRGFRCRTAREGLADEGEAAGPEGGVFYPTTDVVSAEVVPAGTFFPVSYLVIDRVIAIRSSKPSPSAAPSVEYLCKWTGLGYSHATWEAAESLTSPADRAAVERYHYISKPRGPVSRSQWRVPPAKQLVTPPVFKPGCELRDYQRVSFDWMARNQRAKRNVILGDEMGLGKTAQSVSILEHLRTVGPLPGGPFLVVAPLTTLTHWQREVHKWTHMNAVIYDGSAADKTACFKWDFYTDASKPSRPGAKLREWPTGTHPFKFDCLLITYDTLRKEAPVLGTIDWQAMVLDEAHRLKDVNSATSLALRTQYVCHWMLMLTGTPVQNNLSELFGLLHLLDREHFPSLSDFEERFCPGGVVEAARMPALAAALKPYLLRRMKEDVENIPEKEECVVWVEMTADQRAYYKALHESKMHVLLAANSRKNMPNSRNLLMELRHCCNHPFLLTGIQDDFTRRRVEAAAAAVPPMPAPGPVELLVSASGKMVLLAKLLPKLKTDGHKVLIFSQFKMVLNLLQDLCHAMGWPAERLDGDTTAAERQAGIDRFNDPDGGGFVYLLSTRAGGMGITLTAADTAIIYDSDWNPQQDLQAMARCHRIGQTKSVRVYRLVTRGTYEEAILKAASRKFGLDEALLGAPGDSDGAAGGPDPLADVARIESLLKHGVGAFSEAAVAETQRFVAEGIEDILDKRVERRQVGSRKGNTFSTATFVAEEDGAAGGMVPEDALLGDGAAPSGLGVVGGPSSGAEFWATFLPDAVAREVADPHSKRKFVLDGPRQRKRVDYSIKALASAGREDDYDLGDESDSDSGGAGGAARTPSWTPTQVLNLETFLVSFGFGSREAAVSLFQRSATVIPKEEAEEVATALQEMLTIAVHHVTGGTSDAVATAKAAAAEEEKEKAAAAAATAEGAGPKPLEEEDVDAELHAKLEAVAKPACARKALSSRRVTLRMQRNGARYALRLAERAALLERVCPDGSTELTTFDVPGCGRAQPPAPWWGIQEDRDLMRGSLRHGFTPFSPDLWKAQHRAIRLDPDLCFGAILARLDEQDKARKEAEAAALAQLVGTEGAAAAATAGEAGAAAAPLPSGLPTATPAMPPGFDDDDGEPAPVAPKQKKAIKPAPPEPEPEAEAEPPAEAQQPGGEDGDVEMRGEEDGGEREGGEGGEGAPRGGRPTVRGPLALGSTRCGSCKSCLNPKLKQACFTRRREEGGMLPSGAGSTRGPPQPGESFWPLGAVLKRRLQKLLEGLLRPANTEPKPPRKRVRPSGASAAARKPDAGEGREAEEGEEEDEIEEDEDMGEAPGASPQAPPPPAASGKKKRTAKEAGGGAAPAPTPPKGRKRGRSASPGARPAAEPEAAPKGKQQQQPAGKKQATLPFVIPKKQA